MVRMNGESTRLVDKYIQDIFNNPGKEIIIIDHYSGYKAAAELTKRVWKRLCFEHRANMRKDFKHSQTSITFLGGINND